MNERWVWVVLTLAVLLLLTIIIHGEVSSHVETNRIQQESECRDSLIESGEFRTVEAIVAVCRN